MGSKQLTIVRHGQDRDLGDGTVAALDTTSALVNSRQIGVATKRQPVDFFWTLLTGNRGNHDDRALPHGQQTPEDD